MEKYILIKAENFEQARKKIEESKKQNQEVKIIFSSEDDELNRKILEKLEINILLLNQRYRKDFQKQRNSGLNQVLAKEMQKKSITLGINIDELTSKEKEMDKKEKAEILARIKQNIELCNKNNLKVKFISENKPKSSYELKALGLVLGIPTSVIKDL